jgi:hypothetical protein
MCKEKDKMELMISSGYRYDAQSGNIYGMNGKLITKKSRSGYIIVIRIYVDIGSRGIIHMVRYQI